MLHSQLPPKYQGERSNKRRAFCFILWLHSECSDAEVEHTVNIIDGDEFISAPIYSSFVGTIKSFHPSKNIHRSTKNPPEKDIN